MCLSLMFRGLFIKVSPKNIGKFRGQSPSLSKRLKIQSKKEKYSKFVQICGPLLRSDFGIVNI